MRAEFEEFWDRASWITDGTQAFLIDLQYNSGHLSEGSIDYSYTDENKLIIHHELYSGLDRIHKTTVTSDEFVKDAAERITEVTSHVKNRLDEERETDQDLISDLIELRDLMEANVEVINEIEELHEESE